MIRRSILLIISILLLISNLSFSQVENPYMDFNPEALKAKPEYNKNFNPGNFNSKVLYNCMIDMINLARAQYFFLDPLKTDKDMNDCAQMQADYQAMKDEKTDINEAPYRTTFFRLKKYGLTYHATELVTKAKATMGTQEYSYYDLCFELLKPIFKNYKTAVVILDKQFTYIGFGYETDEYMRSMYASLILGNDLTFNPDKADPMDKNVPYSKNKSGMTFPDDKICAKCLNDKNLEKLSEYITVKDGEVFINCGDHKALKKLIGKEGDAIAFDFIQHDQYDCKGNNIDNDRINKGFLSKMITFESILAANTITDKKSTKLYAKVADVPEEIDLDATIDVNIIIVKEGKYACRNIIKKAIECKHADYKEKINYKPDFASMKSKGEWVAAAEEGTHSCSFPFTLQKQTFAWEDLDSTVNATLSIPAHSISKIEIIAQNSVNYSTDQNQQKIQKKRAESVQKLLAQHFPGIETTITFSDGWEDFKSAINNNTEYYDLALQTKAEAIKMLRANNSEIAKILEKDYLSKNRYIKLVFHVNYSVDGENANLFAAWKFNRMMSKKNLSMAVAIQNYLVKKVENGECSIDAVNELRIPNNAKYQQLLNNKLYMQYYLATELNDQMVNDMTKVAAYDPANPIEMFNVSLGKVYYSPINSLGDIAKIQSEIEKLYAQPALQKEEINNLNLEFQFKIIDYINSNPPTPEGDVLYTTTFDKIKTITNKKLSSWQNAYKLASYFVKNYDYQYALSIMEPFLDDASISDDFIFSYISICAYRQETYLSSMFTKAVKIGAARNITRLCGLFDRLPICVFDNVEVKKLICKECGR